MQAMNTTSGTDKHIKIWHKDFWKLNAVAFLLTLSVYMPLLIIVQTVKDGCDYADGETSVVLGIQGVGMLVLGAACSYLIQRYRRNKACVLSMLAVAACLLAIAYARDNMLRELEARHMAFAAVAVQRFAVGLFYGLACQMLHSTLVVDCCASLNRTLANMTSAWAHRLAIVAAPVICLSLKVEIGESNVLYLSAALCVVAVGLLSSVSFPFKAPEETCRVLSLDRFFMPRGVRVAFLVFSVAVLFGLQLAANRSLAVYVAAAAGFVGVLAFQLRSDFSACTARKVAGAGLTAMSASSCLMYSAPEYQPAFCFGMLLFSAGVAVVWVSFQRRLLDLSDHCQRGTAQSTYVLAVELGFAVGMAIEALPLFSENSPKLLVSVAGSFSLLALYFYFVSPWIENNIMRQRS